MGTQLSSIALLRAAQLTRWRASPRVGQRNLLARVQSPPLIVQMVATLNAGATVGEPSAGSVERMRGSPKTLSQPWRLDCLAQMPYQGQRKLGA